MKGVCMNIAAIHGGVAFNVIPQRGSLEWSLRPAPGFDRAKWDHDVALAIAAADEEDRAARPPHRGPARDSITLTTPVDHAPFACAALADEVRPFVSKVGPLDFWTEAALYQAHGIDAVVIGPGDIGQAHAADEFVTLEDLDWAVDLYRSLLASA
jgi:acetylornithine deacetylase